MPSFLLVSINVLAPWFEIPGILKWSPIKYRYKNWAGIYEEFGRYINVNRGFGFLAYPGRIGIWPEVTLLELEC